MVSASLNITKTVDNRRPNGPSDSPNYDWAQTVYLYLNKQLA